MTLIVKSTVVNADVETVWREVGDFARMAEWHPLVTASVVDGGPSSDVGAVRTCTLANDARVTEKLVARDEAAHSFAYEFLESPMPMSDAATEVELRPVTDVGHTYVEWRMRYVPQGEAGQELAPMIDGMIQAGFDNLRARFGGSSAA